MPADHPRHEGMGQIKSHAMRAQRLVRRIVEMNRDVAGEVSYHNLEVLIRDHEDIIQIILPKSVQLDLKFPDEEMLVYLDEVAFRQALTHFVTNTREVLPNGGTFGIDIEATAGGFNVHIWDDGPGIPHDVRPRIFQPFCSEKMAPVAMDTDCIQPKLSQSKQAVGSTLGDNKYPRTLRPLPSRC